MTEALRTELQAKNIDIEPEWETDRVLRNGSQWALFRKWQVEGKDYYWSCFGDFKTGSKEEWTSAQLNTPEEKKAYHKQVKSALRLEKEAKEKAQIDIAIELAQEWATFLTEGTHPYLKRKQINQLFGARLMTNPQGDPILVVPLRDSDGRFWNYQRIYAARLSHGDKFFSSGARIEGCFHTLQSGDGALELRPEDTLVISEGYATGASLAMALGESYKVVCAFYAGNILPVAQSLREKYPEQKIIIAADNDALNKDGTPRLDHPTKDEQGKSVPFNVGLYKAREAVGTINAELRYPRFKYPKPGLSDFNDLMGAEGLDRVREQVTGPMAQGDLEPICIGVTPEGKPKRLTQAQVSRHLHATPKYQGKTLRDRQGNLFVFSKTHWVESFKKDGEVLSDLNRITHEKLGYHQLVEHYEHFSLMAPRAPEHVNLHVPNPLKANFLNGTLHLVEGQFTFTPKHEPGHYLNSVLPVEYTHWAPGDELPPAPEFDAWLERIFQKSPDKHQLIAFYHELIGAALMPYHPVIVHFWGPPASGKSTLIKFIAKLVGTKNCSIVQPCDMKDDALTSMMGKLLNYHTDISVNKPMVEEVMKTIQDRIPLTVRRKYMEAIVGPMPYFHLFGSNGPMVTRDGASQAMGRRAYEIYTPGWGAQGTEGLDFEERILRDPVEMRGVLARALKSLHERNQRRGHFIRIESSAERIREMELSSDYVGQFLRDIRNGDIDDGQTALGFKTGTLKRSQSWTFFQNWFKDTHPQRRGLTKYEFFKTMEKKGFHAQKLHGHQVYKGLDAEVQRESMT